MQSTTKQNLLIGGLLLLTANLTLAAPIFTPGSQPTGWVSRPVITFFDVASGTEAFYQLDYRKDTWAGNVLANDVNSTARIQTTGPWDNADPTLTTAASLLDSMNFSTDRKIATTGGAFRWASLTDAEKTALGSEAIMNFVRGDRSNEEPNAMSLRKRESVLADILHSTIHYWDDGTNQTLYVGSNDGMLHSFNANTGVENFAYIPSMLIPKLSRLADKPYVHTHFVDGPISIANMDISGNQKTVLIGGLGAGGTGLFALDITTPTAANESAVASKVLWEITATGSFSNLGHTYGTPLLTKLANGTAAVIIGNGYVNSGNGHAVLYVINAITGALISAIDTGSGSVASPNGLSSPALFDTDGDAKPDYAYAGDIDGNFWKFDLSSNTSSLLLVTSPAQAITTAPVVRPHPLGGQMIAFATGRILTSGDKGDTSNHHVYGIWDGAPAANNQLLTQTLTTSNFGLIGVRTVTNNLIDWSAGAGHHKGWKVSLRPGERVVGEKPFFNNGRFYFLATNPTTSTGENWLHELVFNTGGSPLGPIFDLNEDGFFNDSDLAANNNIPVAKFLGNGVFSQPRLVNAFGLTTTLYAFHPDLPVSDGVAVEPEDPGVSGGHFDFDIYYYDREPVSTGDDQTRSNICAKKKDVEKELDELSPNYCTASNGFDEGYELMTDYTENSSCGKKLNYFDITCSTFSLGIAGDYAKVKHEHEYDDKYDVTGVNMLNASVPDFNLSNAIGDPTTEFKILVMNQYLNPAAKLSVGGVDYVNVKEYGNLASETNAVTLLNSLPIYSRNTIGTLIYNLPIDAFKSKDWWGDGGSLRAGLIPTQTGCVNKVNADGTMVNDKSKGLIGPNGERFDGALTIQIIKPTTPSSALELNGPDVTYGWRVKQADFTTFVLVEYTSFWHHPNDFCYGDNGWVADAPEDFESKDSAEVAAPGSADPKDGIFGAGLAIISVVVTVDGSVTTTTTTYSDGSEYIKTETENEDGTKTIHQRFRDGTEITTIISSSDGGHAGSIDPNTGSPEEELSTGTSGRQSWRDMLN